MKKNPNLMSTLSLIVLATLIFVFLWAAYYKTAVATGQGLSALVTLIFLILPVALGICFEWKKDE